MDTGRVPSVVGKMMMMIIIIITIIIITIIIIIFRGLPVYPKMLRQTHVDHAATGATGQGHIPKNSCASAVFSTSRRWDNLGQTKGSPNQKKCWWHYLSVKKMHFTS